VTSSGWRNALIGCAISAEAGMHPSNKMGRNQGEIHDWAAPSLYFEGEAGLTILVFFRVRGPLDRKSLAQ
jgi:hypothetical protein